MRPQRPCLGLPDRACPALTRNPGARCRPCELEHQRRRSRARLQYQGSWKRASQWARRAQPFCSVCGTPYDLTLDHETGQVQCRSHNSAHRRDAS